MHPLDGARRKLKRATRKLNELEGVITGWLAANPYDTFQETHPEASVHFLRAHIRQQPDPEWSLEVGEAMGQVRSALDHLVQQLVIANGGQPTRQNAFPIYKRAKDFDPRKIAGINPRWQSEIKSLQPYEAKDALTENPLIRINALANFDKHIDIHPVVVGTLDPVPWENLSLRLGDTFKGGWLDVMLYPFNDEPIDGAVLAGAHFEIFDPEASFDRYPRIRSGVAFGEGRITTGEMHDLVRIVRKILSRFEPAFN